MRENSKSERREVKKKERLKKKSPEKCADGPLFILLSFACSFLALLILGWAKIATVKPREC